MRRPGCLARQHLDGVGVGMEVTLRVRLGARALAEHVKGAQRKFRLAGAAGERGLDGVADDEGVPEQLHRLAHGGAHDRRYQRRREVGRGELPRELRGDVRQQAPGGPEQHEPGAQQQCGVAGHARGAHRGQALADQLVGALGVGRAQQRLGEAHERLALGAVEGELLEHLLHQGPGALIGARLLHPARRARLRAAQQRLARRQLCADLVRGLRLGAQRGRPQALAQRQQFAGRRGRGGGDAHGCSAGVIVNYAYDNVPARE